MNTSKLTAEALLTASSVGIAVVGDLSAGIEAVIDIDLSIGGTDKLGCGSTGKPIP